MKEYRIAPRGKEDGVFVPMKRFEELKDAETLLNVVKIVMEKKRDYEVYGILRCVLGTGCEEEEDED